MTEIAGRYRDRWRPRFLALTVALLVIGTALARADGDLLQAADGGDVAAVRAALAAGADVEARDAIGATPLLVAAAANPNTSVLAALLDAGADVTAVDTYGWTALHRAAFLQDDPRRLVLLLAAGAPPDAVDTTGRTPLMLAAERGREPLLLDALLDGGAEPWYRDAEDRRALDLAWDNTALAGTSSLDRLERATAAAPPAGSASRLSESERRSVLLAELAQRPERFLAIVREGSLADILAALDHGADVTVTDTYGQTPLTYAADHGTSAVIDALVDAGADVRVLTNARWTPLMYAARRGDRTVAQALLDHGVDPAARDDSGASAADVAVAHGHDALAAWIEAEVEGRATAATPGSEAPAAASPVAAEPAPGGAAPSVVAAPVPIDPPPARGDRVVALPPPSPPGSPPATALPDEATEQPSAFDATAIPATSDFAPISAIDVGRDFASALDARDDACVEARGDSTCVLLLRSLDSARTLVTVVVGNLDGYRWRSALWLPTDSRQTVLENSLVAPDGAVYDVYLFDEHAATAHTPLNTIGKTLVMITGPR